MTTTPPTARVEGLKLEEEGGEESNPWASKSTKDGEDGTAGGVSLQLTNPPPVAEPVFTPAPTPPVVDSTILTEFDPLADREGQDAQNAWAAAEAHPRQQEPEADVHVHSNPTAPSKSPESQSPQRTPKEATQKALPPDPESPSKPPPVASSSASALTNTFANLARSFSRPRSAGPDVPASPAPPGPSRLSGELSSHNNAPLSSTSARTDSKGKATEAQFDFQKFLDQLKTRGAEPVAQYFRRSGLFAGNLYNPLTPHPASSIISQGGRSTFQTRSNSFSSSSR